MKPLSITPPYLLFIGDVTDPLAAKTANGIARWRPEWSVGQLRMGNSPVDLGVPDLTLAQAWEKGARTLVLGVANPGGVLPAHWKANLLEALEAGYDLANGLHHRLADEPDLARRATELGRKLIDVRQPPGELPVGTGARRSGRRLLTVGTDCSTGKMFTTLALHRELVGRGVAADFVATGQTGILIGGSGIAIDAVVSDFISGAVETLAPAHPDPEHWDLIEGQGCLFHPSYAGVSLGLLHGAQAEALILCHDAARKHIRHRPDYPLPTLQAAIARNEEAARLTAPGSRVIGISVNTSHLAEADARGLLTEIETDTGLPATDAFRFGAAPLADALLAL